MKKTYIAPEAIVVRTYGDTLMAPIGSVKLQNGGNIVDKGTIYDNEIDEAGAKGSSTWNGWED